MKNDSNTKHSLTFARYIGELSPSNFSTPIKTNHHITMIKNKVSMLHEKNKVLVQHTSRLQKKIFTLESVVNDLKKKILAYENNIKVRNLIWYSNRL